MHGDFNADGDGDGDGDDVVRRVLDDKSPQIPHLPIHRELSHTRKIKQD